MIDFLVPGETSAHQALQQRDLEPTGRLPPSSRQSLQAPLAPVTRARKRTSGDVLISGCFSERCHYVSGVMKEIADATLPHGQKLAREGVNVSSGSCVHYASPSHCEPFESASLLCEISNLKFLHVCAHVHVHVCLCVFVCVCVCVCVCMCVHLCLMSKVKFAIG